MSVPISESPRSSESVARPLDGISSWLNTKGFALEFRVAEVMTTTDWKPQMATCITGRSADDVPRDVDVLGSRCVRHDKAFAKCTAYLLVECKHIPAGDAWVLLGEHLVHEPARTPAYVPHYRRGAIGADRLLAPVLSTPEKAESGQPHAIVSHGVQLARNVLPAKQDARRCDDKARDSCAEALNKVAELSWSLASNAKSWFEETKYSDAVLVVPCIVVSGALARVAFDPAGGRLSPHWIDRGAVIVQKPPEATLVHIVEERSLGAFLQHISKRVDRWGKSLLAPPQTAWPKKRHAKVKSVKP